MQLILHLDAAGPYTGRDTHSMLEPIQGDVESLGYSVTLVDVLYFNPPPPEAASHKQTAVVLLAPGEEVDRDKVLDVVQFHLPSVTGIAVIGAS